MDKDEITQAPCKGCENRVLGCHSVCEKYITFRKWLDNRNKKEIIKKRMEGNVIGYNQERKEKQRKRIG